MIEGLVQQFLGSGEAAQVLGQLQQQGLSPQQAQGAVTATANGVAQAASQGDLSSLLGSGAALGMLGSLLGGGQGGGGLGGLIGALAGGAPAGQSAAPAGGLPPQIVDSIAGFVTEKTGLAQPMAKTVVGIVLPQIIDFVKSKLG